MNKLYNNLIGS